MPNKRWKDAERRVAAFFGCLRTILSGSSAHVRTRETNSDTDHARLFIEVRQRESHGVWSWYRETKEEAARESKRSSSPQKIPVIALDEVRAPGFIVCVHCDDLEDFCRVYLKQCSAKKSA